MQVAESFAENVPAPVLAESSEHPDITVIHMRALRRKARRISAFARFNVSALTSLAVQVEADLAALQH